MRSLSIYSWHISFVLCATLSLCRAAFLVPKAKQQTSKDVSKKNLRPVAGIKNATAFGAIPGTGGSSLSNSSLPPPIQQNSTALHTDVKGTGVVYFLFLLGDNLHHQDLWKKFFAGASKGSYKVLIHCKDSAGCARNKVFLNNPQFLQVPTTPTWYCHDLVTAMASLLSNAMNLKAASLGANEKFVFLSESTLPTKPFSEIHSSLLLDTDSDICLFPSDQWGSGSIDGKYVKLLKHHQWVVLNRAHAEVFIQNWVPVNARSEWRIWLRTGSWKGQPRFLFPQSFYYPASANTCTDEYAFMATIFGALEPMKGHRTLQGFGGGSVDMNSHLSQGRCRTWTYWDNSWDPAATTLASEIANDYYGSSISCFPKCYARPATLVRLSSSSLHAIRRSSFLFVRKFSPSIWLPNYENIVFGE